ncbi:MAG: molybdopterin-dependent oxidoreductase [Paracoccaceae bacterium]|nr:molybdopterin-dependent oxidoreductase [Paracoccaceae bacterium]
MSLEDYPRVSDWLALADGKLQVRTGKVDIGQRISTALVGIVQHELTLWPAEIDVQPVSTKSSPDEGMTSGSNSIEQSGHALRLAAATLRAKILAHLSDRLGGEANDWTLDAGELTGPGTNRPLVLLHVLAEIDLDMPVDPDARIAEAGAVKGLDMRGLPELVKGSYRFLHDLDLPGMLHALVIRPPHAKARLAEIQGDLASKLEEDGFHILRDGSFLAVAGPQEWPVVRAAQRLANACDWDLGDGLGDGDIFSALTQENAIRLTVEDGKPVKDAPIPQDLPDTTHRARYERPFTMHGALAPSAACATWDGETLEITTHSQGIYILRDSIAESLGLPPEKVVLTFMPGSGCYGHSAADDAAFEAALLAMAVPNTPILLKWIREDEHAWEPYGPASATEVAAKVGTDGRLQAFSAEAIGGTFRGRPRTGPNQAGPAKLLANHFRSNSVGPQPGAPNMNRHGGLQRNLVPIYDIPETRFVKNLVPEMPLRTSALRCLGAALNVFAIECFMDEIARERGADPFAFRRAHLKDGRAMAVLDRLESELDARPLAEGAGRGIAYAQYKNAMTRVGASVDLTVTDAAEIELHRILLVADAGRIVDRDGLAAQLEGGALQAASWALHEAVTWDRDGITSRDWDSYPVLRFSGVPEIDVILLDQPESKSLGAGEASPGPVLAAIANAVCDATGLRARRLPMTSDALTSLALQE